MKLIASTLAAIAIGTTGLAHAYSYEPAQNDAHASHEATVKKVSVKYKCSKGGRLNVTYGFNSAGLPTYAQAKLNGKARFMPINLGRSDDVSDTVFGDDNNFRLSAERLTLKGYRQAAISTIQSPGNEILYKSCSAR